jgi:hypothetical protein
MNRAVVSSYTARTTAFATATGITDTTILGALNTFDLGLISNGLDTKIRALYPFVGGSASTHKYNFMDSRDLDVAYRLQFNGGWTHSSNGVLTNGANTYADTYCNVIGTKNNNHLSLYIKTNVDEVSADIGITGNVGGSGCPHDIEPRISNTCYFTNFVGSGHISFTNTDSRGFYINTRLSSIHKGYKNNTLIGTNTTPATDDYNGSISIGARWNSQISVPQFYSSKQFAFASVGTGLSDSEASTFYNLVQAMETTLSRQV